MIPDSIREKFTLEFKRDETIIRCPKCPDQWTHPVKPMQVGTILHLLNHAARHETSEP